VPVVFTGWQEIPLGVPETAKLFKHKGGNFQLPTGTLLPVTTYLVYVVTCTC
jgi:hypothetical protein